MHRWLFLILTMSLVRTASADMINASVNAKADSMRVALYGEGSTLVSIHQIGFFPERGDATRRLPQEKIDLAGFLIRNIDPDADGVLIGATSPTRIDPIHTQGSTTRDINIQEDFQQGRARFVNDITGRRCIVAPEGIHNDAPCVYLMIVRRAPGTPSLVPGRVQQVNINLQGIRDTLAKFGTTLNNHERRIKALEDRPPGGIQPNDIGLSAFIGYSTYQVDGQTFNGGTLGLTYRYFDFALEGFAGELFSNSRQMISTGSDILPQFSNNHFEGGAVYWAPRQNGYEWGKWYKLGATGMHAQRDNLENVSNLEVYYAGAAVTLAWPYRFLTPEVLGSIGYGWSTMSSTSYETAPLKSEGLGYGLRAALVVGRR